MNGYERVQRLLRTVFRREDEAEIDDEIRLHLELEIEENVRRGMSPREARRRALATFGRVEEVKDDVRDVRRMARLLGDVSRDTRLALRSLPKQPGFVLAVLLTLGIGIGGNVAMFGVLEVAWFRALPYPESEELVLGRVTYEGEVGYTVSGPDFFDYRDQAGSLAGLSAVAPFPIRATVIGSESPERVVVPFVSTGLFRTLGIDPVIGRHFAADEGEPGGPDVVILSHGYWQRSFGGDRDVVGAAINVDGSPTTVIGIMPAGFRFMLDADAWRPIKRGENWASARQFHNFVLIGRLGSGTRLAGAQAEIDVISHQLAEAYPDTNREKGLNLTPLREALNEGYRSTLTLLLAAVALLLLVACANVAGLLMVRGTARRSEMAVRSVMGAGPGRLARQLLTENGLLALGATALGVGLAIWAQKGILSFLSIDGIGPAEATLSGRMLGVALLLTVLTVGLFGVIPAVRVARSEPVNALRSGTRTAGSRRSRRVQSSTVLVQVAFTSVLLIVSGLLLRSFDQLRRVDPGFDAEGLFTVELALPPGEYEDMARRAQFYSRLQDRVAALPGVTAAALINRLPIRDGGGNVRVAPPEEWGADGVFNRLAYQRMVLPGYFETMRIPVLSGRDVALTDDRGASPVMVISASLAADIFPDGGALGRTLGIDVGGDEPWTAEVVGIVGDVAPSSLESGADYTMYFSYVQRSPSEMRLAIRTRGEPAGLVSALRPIVASLDRNVPLTGAATMEDVLAASIGDRRSVMTVLIAFAGIALLLSAVGLYGLLAYDVSRRFHEIGVRMALGASVWSVAMRILRRGLALVGVGLALAIPLSLLAGRFIQEMLYSVGNMDPATYALVALFLGAVATLACLLPARRAASIDPVEAFRAE
jgi:putative ABC transport system permease protein